MNTKLVLSIALITIFFMLIGCGKSENHDATHNKEATGQVKSSIIRDSSIDVSGLDENKDGKLFQCPMDYEVISDESGNCPTCKMKLEEFSVEVAQNNFNKYLENK
jgi:hypothetical protein